jgi:hypothetical protein
MREEFKEMTLPKSACLRLAVIVVFGLLPAFAAAQKVESSFPSPPEIPKFTVKGRVVFDDTSRPVRRAQISLVQLPATRAAEHSSATDRDGRFVIGDVPTGVYVAMVNLPGIISPLAFMSLAERGPPENYDVKAIREYCTEVIVDGEDINVTVHARRGGAISGKITYSDGEPAIDAQVAIIRRSGKKATRVLTGFTAAALMSLRTDDRGQYRIAGIPPGEYVVSAAETNTSPNTRRGRDDFFGGLFSSDALLVTYYGGSSRIDDATRLEVTGGSEASDIDISLQDATPHTVSGSVIAKLDRVPLPGATLSIRMRDQGSWFGSDSQQLSSDNQGTWVFDGVPDGTYVITIEPPPNFPVTGADTNPRVTYDEDGVPQRKDVPMRKFVRQEMEITVSGSDLVVDPIALAEGASISGTVELPKQPTDESIPYYVQITWRYEGEPAGGYGNSTVSADGEFTAEGLHAGKVYLNALPGYNDLNSTMYVKSITLNGIDLRQKPLTISEGQTIRNVRIVIAENPAKGSIKLQSSDGKALPAKRVAVIPTDEGRWLFANEIVEGTTDTRGIFNFTAAPGDYFVIVAAANDLWPPSPEIIRQRAPAATHIKLRSGDNQPVTVVVP